MTQEQKIVDYLDRHGSITQREAITLGCYRLSARIFDLRHHYGLRIKVESRRVRNADGSFSNIAEYTYDRK